MDSNKLKALKVVDLKAILAKANIQVPAKSTKNGLILKIEASKPAQDAYLSLYPPQDDLLTPPEEVDWSVDQPVVVATPVVKEPKQPVTIPKPTTPPQATVSTIDPELEKRQKRAERFGIALIKPNNPSTPETAERKKLEERAARFGVPVPSNDKKTLKRPAAQAEVVDPEELERRKKRAERFGIAKIA